MAEILIVDDESVLREGLALLLSSDGYEVRQAGSGLDAIEAFRQKSPDLVLLDIMMPGMDGFETCSRLHEIDDKVPVIFLTAKDSEKDQELGFELAACDFITKTTSVKWILTRIKNVLERTAGQRRTSPAPRVFPKAITKAESSKTSGTATQQHHGFTRTELDIYNFLAAKKGTYFTYKQIFAAIRGDGYFADEGAIRSHISRMRNKLPKGEHIDTKRGEGFAILSD